MADEEKKEEAPKAEEAPKEEAKKEIPETSGDGGDSGAPASPSKKVKITKMSLVQVEKALESAKGKMGGYNSHYAKSLLARKKVLEGA